MSMTTRCSTHARNDVGGVHGGDNDHDADTATIDELHCALHRCMSISLVITVIVTTTLYVDVSSCHLVSSSHRGQDQRRYHPSLMVLMGHDDSGVDDGNHHKDTSTTTHVHLRHHYHHPRCMHCHDSYDNDADATQLGTAGNENENDTDTDTEMDMEQANGDRQTHAASMVVVELAMTVRHTLPSMATLGITIIVHTECVSPPPIST